MERKMMKTLAVIGFLVALLQLILAKDLDATVILSETIIVQLLAVCFIFAENKTVARVGYALLGVAGVGFLAGFIASPKISGITDILSLIIVVLYLISSVSFLVVSTLQYFGFKKETLQKIVHPSSKDNFSSLVEWKELLDSKAITEEEYTKVKSDILLGKRVKISVEEIKNYKQLVDSNIITVADFESVKKKLFTE
ncbi:MAG: SHOCT domain-containing protein [Anaeroplasmataceae bacterium]|nr:SHOCT domain-containing protein [Anaeroplasmataceae bacterium]